MAAASAPPLAILETTKAVRITKGFSGTLPKSLRAMRPHGQVGLLGVLTGIDEPLNILPVILENIRIQGIDVGSRAMFKDMNRAIAASRLKPVIDRTFGFDQTKEAMRYLRSGKHFGKIVVRVD